MIKVLIVDDSIIFRRVLQDTLKKNPHIKVVGTAENGEEAIKLIRALRPDVVILDVEMPKMNGLETLEEMKRLKLTPAVIMFSTLTAQGAKVTIEALSKGAFDFVQKPTGTKAFQESQKKIEQELVPKILACAESMKRPAFRRVLRPTAPPPQKRPVPPTRVSKAPTVRPRVTTRMAFRPEAVAIGVSTGGPNALNEVIPRFPANFRLPVFLVQHMPPVFTKQLADRLNSKSKLTVKEAEDGELVRPATVYVAPGDFHMLVKKNDRGHMIRLTQDPPVNSCRPAVDPLFESLADAYKGRVVAVVMTGMGHDGRDGAKVLKEKGAYIIAQDQETSVVYGMPKFVAEAGIADKICPLDAITPTILEVCRL